MDILKIIVNALDDVKAEDIIVYNMQNVSPILDYVVVCTTTNKRQSDAIAKHLKDDLFLAGFFDLKVEGKSSGWVLADCKDVVVHIFSEEDRELYDLDTMWKSIPQVDYKELLD